MPSFVYYIYLSLVCLFFPSLTGLPCIRYDGEYQTRPRYYNEDMTTDQRLT